MFYNLQFLNGEGIEFNTTNCKGTALFGCYKGGQIFSKLRYILLFLNFHIFGFFKMFGILCRLVCVYDIIQMNCVYPFCILNFVKYAILKYFKVLFYGFTKHFSMNSKNAVTYHIVIYKRGQRGKRFFNCTK